MTGRFDVAEAFAYVDDCLAPAERRAFEARLREDPELKREVALWESQNGAIRAAYGAAFSPRATIDLGRNSNENLPVWMTASSNNWRSSPRSGAPSASPARAKEAAASQSAAIKQAAPRTSLGRGLLAIAAFAAALLLAAPPAGPAWQRDKLIDAGLAAYRAFAAPAALTPVEFRASDPGALTRWFAPHFARAVVVPRLPSGTLTLLGGRLAPGTTASAAFVIYEDALGGRVGLLIEPLDAPAPAKPTMRQLGGVSLAAWTDAGHGLVAVGPDPDSVAALARLMAGAPR